MSTSKNRSPLDRTAPLRAPGQSLTEQLQDEAYDHTCASCGIKLVERTPAKGGAGFWGCSNYPRCKSRLPMVAALR